MTAPRPSTHARRIIVERVRNAICGINVCDRTADTGTLMAEAALSIFEQDPDDTMYTYMTASPPTTSTAAQTSATT